ncbi:hypothetical protein Zmor_012122 [Zophobas morio]|uniref:HEAT repeat-containing protein 1 n=1 Tax=Zophobas morio TaxID=2755281 RepID=A0AA38LZ29_9CUCU|nr:hypothetical protein Zmor_012122 [Zophobas morio]
MTSLSSQLKRLSFATGNLSKKSKDSPPSFLFNKTKAQDTDLDFVYGLALNGLAELCKLCPKFEEFEETIFSLKLKKADRRLMTDRQVADLNSSIQAYLTLLNPFFLLKAAHKTIEYLVRHFYIHVHNVDSLMACAFPYHDSFEFVKLLKLFSFKQSFKQVSSRWAWMFAFKKIHNSIMSLVTVYDYNSSRLSSAINSYGALIATAIEISSEVKEEFVIALLPCILDGFNLGEKCFDLCISAYVISSALSARAFFSKHLLNSLLHPLVENLSVSLQPYAFQTFLVFCQTQQAADISHDVFIELCKFEGLYLCYYYYPYYGTPGVAVSSCCEKENLQVYSCLLLPLLVTCLSSESKEQRSASLQLLHALENEICTSDASFDISHLKDSFIWREVSDTCLIPEHTKPFLLLLLNFLFKDALVRFIYEFSSLLNDARTRASLVTLLSTHRRSEKMIVIFSGLLMKTVCCDSAALSTEDLTFLSCVAEMFDESCSSLFESVPSQCDALSRGQKLFKVFLQLLNCPKNQLLSALLNIARDTAQSPTFVTAVKETICSLSLTADHVHWLFKRMGVIKDDEAFPCLTGKRACKSLTADKNFVERDLQTLIVFLELFERNDPQHLTFFQRPSELFPLFFALLEHCVNLDFTTFASVENAKQLTLSGSLTANFLFFWLNFIESSVNVELIVRCVRGTDNPRTRQHALLLLATMAAAFPSKVLHNIMSIFTFMGTDLSRQDDSYTFHVIRHTLEKLIPPLLTSCIGDLQKSLSMVLDMMKVFVSAYWHIPQHRRLCLFTHLITCLGPCKYLSAFIILLQVTHNAIPSKSECCSEVEASEASLSDFCASLLQQFPLRTQVKSFEEMLLLAVALPSVLPSTRSEKTKVAARLS